MKMDTHKELRKHEASKYLTVCIEFRCNNQCISCMLKPMKTKLKPVSFETYKKVIEENLKSNKYSLLILSGAEITMNKDLLKFVNFAQKCGNFEHIRIQTNGRKLSDYEYCKSLIEAGVDEFFVSVYGPDARVHESMTTIKGSFVQTLEGAKNLNKLNASIITNTVITRLNYKSLPNLAEKFSSFKNVKEMQFWNCWPMSRSDKNNLLARYMDIRPYLFKAIDYGQNRKLSIVIKYFPECLLQHHGKLLDNSQPYTIIDDLFWKVVKLCNPVQCIFWRFCSSIECQGLPLAYIKKFGWEREILKPKTESIE